MTDGQILGSPADGSLVLDRAAPAIFADVVPDSWQVSGLLIHRTAVLASVRGETESASMEWPQCSIASQPPNISPPSRQVVAIDPSRRACRLIFCISSDRLLQRKAGGLREMHERPCPSPAILGALNLPPIPDLGATRCGTWPQRVKLEVGGREVVEN
jgi:hypothetical protein